MKVKVKCWCCNGCGRHLPQVCLYCKGTGKVLKEKK